MTALSLGVVGAGRTRNGLGPFLADFAERAGFRVTAVAGRSMARAVENAAELRARLGHEVTACHDLDQLCRAGIDALVIASPTVHHLEALQAAARAAVPVLCEKPLIYETDGAAGTVIVEAFANANLAFMEICQWPYMLPALQNLRGDVAEGSPRRIELGLAPARPGREMVQSSLPHLLSVVQALMPVGAGTTARRLRLDPHELDGRPAVLRFALEGPGPGIEVALHMHVCAAPPRPVWLEIDGVRMHRHVAADYSFSFDGPGGRIEVRDPTQQLVHRFAELVRVPEPFRIQREIDRVRQRLRLYREILGMLP